MVMWLPVQLSWGQGTTTASMTGEVTDARGEGLPGATVVAVHTPSNTQYAASTNEAGRFNLQNMRVGGPYTITTTYIGYQDQRRENIFLSLGQTLRLDVSLSENAVGLNEVQVVSERGSVINADRTGAATNVSREQIERLPTLNRSLQDFTRLTPQASGNSLGGANNRYNNITIDGAVNNDVFGLAGTGTPGGQAGTQPISLDAIDQIQVVLAPYDVKFGNFTGGGINAVTRSGTNNWEGSVYGFGRNQNTVGDDPVTGRETAEFKDYQTGFRVGGPVVKDKLFFFLNGEITRRTEPLLFNLGESTSIVPAEDVRRIADTLRVRYGYDPGTFGPVNRRTESNKLFGRLDWNITDRHQLTLRHNFVDAFDDNITRTNTTFRFGNNAYQFNSITNSTVAELRSRFSESLSNSLIVGYSRIRDKRDTPGALFPQVTIRFLNSGSNTISAGTERSSAFNELDQDIFEFTDNFTIFRGNHTITLGTHNEFFKFRNLFINNYNGYYQFNNVQDFYARRPFQIEQNYSTDPNNPTPAAEFNAMQLGFYAQDEIDLFPTFRLTLGVRLDVPVIPDAPARNQAVEAAFENIPQYTNLRTDETPSGLLLWAPRLGFNWDVKGDKTIQVRGGTGIFTGRVPFVWQSNQFVNNGLNYNTLRLLNQTAPNRFISDVNQIRTLGPTTSTEINLITEDFKIPQTFRSNLAVDYTLPLGIIATLEGIYSKTLNDIVYRDINLLEPTSTLTGPDNRPLYSNARVSNSFTNVILLDNTSKGYTYSLTGQLQKNFNNGINTMVAYTYGRSEDVNSGASSTALSNWQFNQIIRNPNDPELSYSRFDIRHRIISSGGYTFKWLNNFSTSISLFYEGQSGLPFTYLYARDVNNDGNTANDLLYVPRTIEESGLVDLVSSGVVTRTAAQQWADLNSFIENDEYLRTRRGQYSERNGARTPWTHRVDLRLAQDIFTTIGAKQHTLQLTFDVFNVGNLFNEDWGRSYSVNNAAVELVRFVNRNQQNRPTFTFNQPTSTVWTTNFSSRWQGQLGLRYIFE